MANGDDILDRVQKLAPAQRREFLSSLSPDELNRLNLMIDARHAPPPKAAAPLPRQIPPVEYPENWGMRQVSSFAGRFPSPSEAVQLLMTGSLPSEQEGMIPQLELDPSIGPVLEAAQSAGEIPPAGPTTWQRPEQAMRFFKNPNSPTAVALRNYFAALNKSTEVNRPTVNIPTPIAGLQLPIPLSGPYWKRTAEQAAELGGQAVAMRYGLDPVQALKDIYHGDVGALAATALQLAMMRRSMKRLPMERLVQPSPKITTPIPDVGEPGIRGDIREAAAGVQRQWMRAGLPPELNRERAATLQEEANRALQKAYPGLAKGEAARLAEQGKQIRYPMELPAHYQNYTEIITRDPGQLIPVDLIDSLPYDTNLAIQDEALFQGQFEEHVQEQDGEQMEFAWRGPSQFQGGMAMRRDADGKLVPIGEMRPGGKRAYPYFWPTPIEEITGEEATRMAQTAPAVIPYFEPNQTWVRNRIGSRALQLMTMFRARSEAFARLRRQDIESGLRYGRPGTRPMYEPTQGVHYTPQNFLNRFYKALALGHEPRRTPTGRINRLPFLVAEYLTNEDFAGMSTIEIARRVQSWLRTDAETSHSWVHPETGRTTVETLTGDQLTFSGYGAFNVMHPLAGYGIVPLEFQTAQEAVDAAVSGQGLRPPPPEPTVSERLAQIVKDIRDGIIYHGTTLADAQRIMGGGFRELRLGEITNRVLALYGKTWATLTPVQQESLLNYLYGYRYESNRFSTSIGGEVAARWAGSGGEVAKGIEQIILDRWGPNTLRWGDPNSKLTGEPAVVKARVTDRTAEQWERILRDLEQVENGLKRGHLSEEDAIRALWQSYSDSKFSTEQVEPIRVISGPELEQLKRGPTEAIPPAGQKPGDFVVARDLRTGRYKLLVRKLVPAVERQPDPMVAMRRTTDFVNTGGLVYVDEATLARQLMATRGAMAETLRDLRNMQRELKSLPAGSRKWARRTGRLAEIQTRISQLDAVLRQLEGHRRTGIRPLVDPELAKREARTFGRVDPRERRIQVATALRQMLMQVKDPKAQEVLRRALSKRVLMGGQIEAPKAGTVAAAYPELYPKVMAEMTKAATWKEQIADPAIKEAKRQARFGQGTTLRMGFGKVPIDPESRTAAVTAYWEILSNAANQLRIYKTLIEAKVKPPENLARAVEEGELLRQVRRGAELMVNHGINVGDLTKDPLFAHYNADGKLTEAIDLIVEHATEMSMKGRKGLAGMYEMVTGKIPPGADEPPDPLKGGLPFAGMPGEKRPDLRDGVKAARNMATRQIARMYRARGWRNLASFLTLPKPDLVRNSNHLVFMHGNVYRMRRLEAMKFADRIQRYARENRVEDWLRVERMGYIIQGTPKGRAMLAGAPPAVYEIVNEIREFNYEQEELLRAVYGDGIPLHEAKYYLAQVWKLPKELTAPGGVGPDLKRAYRTLMHDPFLKRKAIDSYEVGVDELHLTPRYDNILDIIKIRHDFATRAMINVQMAQTLEALGLIMTPAEAAKYGISPNPNRWSLGQSDPEAIWPKAVDAKALEKATWVGKNKEPGSGDIYVVRPVLVHPDVKAAVDTWFTTPFDYVPFNIADALRATYKKFQLIGGFHWVALSEVAQGEALGRLDRNIKEYGKQALQTELLALPLIVHNSEVRKGVRDALIDVWTEGREGEAARRLRLRRGDPPIFRYKDVEEWLRAGWYMEASDREQRSVQQLRNLGLGGNRATLAATWAFRRIGDFLYVNDKVLWDYFMIGNQLTFMNSAYADWLMGNKNATPEMAFEAKRRIAEHANYAFGSVPWEQLLASPQVVQMLNWMQLAPAWTYSNIRMALMVMNEMLGSQGYARRAARAIVGREAGPPPPGGYISTRWAFGAFLSWFLHTQLLNYATTGWYNEQDKNGKHPSDDPNAKVSILFGEKHYMNAGHFTWDNAGNPFRVLLPTMPRKGHMFPMETVNLPWSENATNIFAGRYPDGKERYIRLGKAFREPFDWVLNPLGTFANKLSTPLRLGITLFTGSEPGGYRIVEQTDDPGVAIKKKMAYFFDVTSPFSMQLFTRSLEHQLDPGTFPADPADTQLFSQPTVAGSSLNRAANAYAQTMMDYIDDVQVLQGQLTTATAAHDDDREALIQGRMVQRQEKVTRDLQMIEWGAAASGVPTYKVWGAARSRVLRHQHLIMPRGYWVDDYGRVHKGEAPFPWP